MSIRYILILLTAISGVVFAGPVTSLQPQPAKLSSYAGKAAVLDTARAGAHVVTVGDYGTVMISDSHGFHQARQVPVDSTLTAVSFVDEQNGWAVGHWGAILHTVDGGETWAIQRLDTAVDRPLFSVHFTDREHGVAVGLWSLLLITEDGGKTWNNITLPQPPDGSRADRNLFSVFAGRDGELYIAAERGTVLSSTDQGKTWSYLDTGYAGSLWTGRVLADGTLVVAGLRGSVFLSRDQGRSWQAGFTHTKSSITGLTELNGKLIAVGLDGVSLSSADGGATFTATQREDKLSLTAVAVSADGSVLIFSKNGWVAPAGRKP